MIYAGEEYATVDMAAVSDVSFSPFMAFVSSVNTVLGNIYVRLLLLIALALVVVDFVRRFQSGPRRSGGPNGSCASRKRSPSASGRPRPAAG